MGRFLPVFLEEVLFVRKNFSENDRACYFGSRKIGEGAMGIEKKDKLPLMVEPEPSEEYMQNLHVNLRVSETNPTVCLMSKEGKAKGILLHEGLGKYPDFELEKKNYKIGNHPTAELYIKKDTISTFHAEIAYNEDAYYIEDLNSTNGTYLNDIPVNYKEKEKLSPGDVIRFADVRYRFM